MEMLGGELEDLALKKGLNSARKWRSLKDLSQSSYNGWVWLQNVHTRELLYDVQVGDTFIVTMEGDLKPEHWTESWLVKEQPPPFTKRTFQGRWFPGGRILEYTFRDEPMRRVRDSLNVTYGLSALTLLSHYLPPEDYTSLREAEEEEELTKSIIEFTLFDRRCGPLDRKMLVWEVRQD